MDEKIVISYIEGEAHVPDDLWALVKRYRQLRNQVDAGGMMYSRKVDSDMNALYDAMLAL